jgi:hypothetical protein
MRSEIVTMSGWNEVKAEFAPDGALRDIYVFDTDRVDWEKMLTALPKSPYEVWQRPYEDEGNKKPASLPVTFPANETKGTLNIKVENELILACHFFTEEEIELDLIPQNASLDAEQYKSLDNKLEYFDLRELQDTITGTAPWLQFEPRFGTKEALNAKFDQLAELRNSIRHSRAVSDIARKEGEAAILWFRKVLSK